MLKPMLVIKRKPTVYLKHWSNTLH